LLIVVLPKVADGKGECLSVARVWNRPVLIRTSL